MSKVFDLWGQRGWAHLDIVGESHHESSFRALFGEELQGGGSEMTAAVQLLPEPANQYDPNAVGVWTNELQLGYLSRADAARYVNVLSALVAQGWAPQVAARVWAGPGYHDRDGVTGSVRLDLGEPHQLVPANPPPDQPHRLLPVGAAIQVTGEDQHLDALVPWLRPEGECWLHATLHELGGTRSLVEVRVGGAVAGRLTPKMSAELLPAIRHLAGQQTTTAVRALVKGNRLKAEVVLYTVRAHELPESWLGTPPPRRTLTDGLVTRKPVTHGPVPPRPTGIRFAVPPEWPQPPDGWDPPPGWRPDPAWPAAPQGWQWWVPVWS